ncbi:MAG: TatD family hydrolase, partial [Actinobacteria bacterium]|nr:TatD family hydrolase [Actinomycetota bacterium]
LVETDAPFLTPHPFRGAQNESYCLPYTVRALAEIRASSAAEIAAVTSENASKSYGL